MKKEENTPNNTTQYISNKKRATRKHKHDITNKKKSKQQHNKYKQIKKKSNAQTNKQIYNE